MVSIIDLTAVLSAIAGISATVFILLQLRHMDKHRDLEISMKLFEWAESDRLHKAFRWIEENFQFENFDKYKADTETNFEVGDYPYEVTAFFEQVGFLIEKRFIDISVIVDRLGAYIMSNWKKLEPWIIALRKEKGDQSFGDHFQKLYARTIEYMKRS